MSNTFLKSTSSICFTLGPGSYRVKSHTLPTIFMFLFNHELLEVRIATFSPPCCSLPGLILAQHRSDAWVFCPPPTPTVCFPKHFTWHSVRNCQNRKGKLKPKSTKMNYLLNLEKWHQSRLSNFKGKGCGTWESNHVISCLLLYTFE